MIKSLSFCILEFLVVLLMLTFLMKIGESQILGVKHVFFLVIVSNPKTYKVISSRDVIFGEGEEWGHQKLLVDGDNSYKMQPTD